MARSGKNYIEQELFGPIKLSGRALYGDGQMINSNVINHKRALELNSFLTNMATAGELRCYDSAIESVLKDIDSALILKEEQRNRPFGPGLIGLHPICPFYWLQSSRLVLAAQV